MSHPGGVSAGEVGGIGKLQREHTALLNGYQLLAGAPRVIDPDNLAQRMADRPLAAAFPLDGTAY